MALGKKRDAIVIFAGGDIAIREVKSDGTELAVPDTTWDFLGFIGSTELDHQISQENKQDETGKTVKVIDKEESAVLKGNFIQSDKDLLDFLRKGCKGKYYQIWHPEGIVDNNHQEVFFAIGQFKPMLNLKSGTKEPAFEITLYPAPADITVDSDTKPTGSYIAADITIEKDDYYEICETAVA